ncbi:hypothetical protein [Streptomyces sp. RFCAC02]|uniref:hypothetical protein n=1 Tax=Streptomyces sp. RFCAC02 TaxID=2499143 RepID=UPI00143D89E6|nr:hypothetical protein [Streptomyces sp. RFCAC02]
MRSTTDTQADVASAPIPRKSALAGGLGLPEGLDDTYDQLVQMYLANLGNES